MGAIELKSIILVFGIIAGCFFAVCGVWLHKSALDRSAKGAFTGEGGGFRITLTNYGPGVAIALFGAFVVVFCITRAFSQTSTTLEMNTTTTTNSADNGLTIETNYSVLRSSTNTASNAVGE